MVIRFKEKNCYFQTDACIFHDLFVNLQYILQLHNREYT